MMKPYVPMSVWKTMGPVQSRQSGGGEPEV